ncbi:MAG: hypothetical protein WAT43_00090 [Chitinophagales bacterium]
MHLNTFMYSSSGDGLKNYFTLQSYINQPAADGYFHYSQMNYPYGDFIWYTDNSPFIALLLRFIHLNITPVHHPIAIMHLLIMLNLLAAAFVVRKILKRFIQNEWLLIFASIILVWTSPQFFRLFCGHYNLSFSVFYFIAIEWCFRWYAALENKGINKNIYLAANMGLLLFIASGIHLYYMLLLGLPVGLFVFFTAVLKYKMFAVNLKKYIVTIAGIAIGVITIVLCIRFTDGYLSLRSNTPDGVDVSNWQARLFHFYKAKSQINSIAFIGGYRNFDPENAPYLGNFFWYLTTISLLFFLFRFIIFNKVKIPKPTTLFWVTTLTVVFVFFAARGEEMGFLGLDNYFNPLYWLGKVYPPIIHFRCIARFTWWIFYLLPIALIIYIDRFVFIPAPKIKMLFYICGAFLVALDVKDVHKFYNSRISESDFIEKNTAVIPDINYNDYQAILPIPYYTVGNEDYNYTIDNNENWFRYTCQLQIKSQLPLISVRLSRTPVSFTKNIFTLFQGDSISATLLKQLNNKPILVIYNPKVEESSNLEPAATIIKIAPDIIEKYHMEKIAQQGNTIYYKWNIK